MTGAAAPLSQTNEFDENSVSLLEFVFECYVLPHTLLSKHALHTYMQPILHQRLNCVLDLDKTLLFSVRADNANAQQRRAAVSRFSANGVELLLIVRPGLREFFNGLAEYFDFSFCTMGTREYAVKIYDQLRTLFPDLPWQHCKEIVSAEHTRLYSQPQHGYKDLRMMYPFAHWRKWRNTCVIVDDTLEVWPVDSRPSVYRIEEFLGDMSEPVDGSCGLLLCLDVLRRLYRAYYTQFAACQSQFQASGQAASDYSRIVAAAESVSVVPEIISRRS
eukprot:TRINITY_DN20086_c0_g1_i8.p1 TRINITY_DN20086_c0_g1~~TRINITY_DN20086_c0_g1_i8.p1  ORF type:complete len:300 (-),score=55.49 TRINITY_DN20086_c0_g1_i8:198-1022(-)